MQIHPDVYLKKLSYNGGLLNDSLLHLSPDTNAAVRVEVAGDGARLNFQVTDSDGKPGSDAPVILVPEGELPAALLADRLLQFRTDPDSKCTSDALAPGDYRALVLSRQLRLTPEDLEQLAVDSLAGRHCLRLPKTSQRVDLHPVRLK